MHVRAGKDRARAPHTGWKSSVLGHVNPKRTHEHTARMRPSRTFSRMSSCIFFLQKQQQRRQDATDANTGDHSCV